MTNYNSDNMPRNVRSTFFFATLFLLGFGSILTTGLRAQIVKDTTHWNDLDLYTEDATTPAYFSVGGGILGGLFMPNLDEFNSLIAKPFNGTTVSNSIWMIGGQGFATLPFIKNVRVGGLGFSGASALNCVNDTSADLRAVCRQIEYHVGYGALTIDYVLPLHLKHFSIVPGVAVGAGSIQIYAQQAQNRLSAFDINDDFSKGINITHTYQSSFLLVMPQVQFEYTIKGFSMVRASLGYQISKMGTWTVDRNVSLGDTKNLANVNGSGLVASIGVFFGLFP
jgi:hypothetical protein